MCQKNPPIFFHRRKYRSSILFFLLFICGRWRWENSKHVRARFHPESFCAKKARMGGGDGDSEAGGKKEGISEAILSVSRKSGGGGEWFGIFFLGGVWDSPVSVITKPLSKHSSSQIFGRNCTLEEKDHFYSAQSYGNFLALEKRPLFFRSDQRRRNVRGWEIQLCICCRLGRGGHVFLGNRELDRNSKKRGDTNSEF